MLLCWVTSRLQFDDQLVCRLWNWDQYTARGYTAWGNSWKRMHVAGLCNVQVSPCGHLMSAHLLERFALGVLWDRPCQFLHSLFLGPFSRPSEVYRQMPGCVGNACCVQFCTCIWISCRVLQTQTYGVQKPCKEVSRPKSQGITANARLATHEKSQQSWVWALVCACLMVVATTIVYGSKGKSMLQCLGVNNVVTECLGFLIMTQFLSTSTICLDILLLG